MSYKYKVWGISRFLYGHFLCCTYKKGCQLLHLFSVDRLIVLSDDDDNCGVIWRTC